MNTSIIILAFNNLAYTIGVIESIKKHTPEGTYEIIVVDNGSTDGTPLWLKGEPGLKTVLNPANLGFSAGCNQGIAQAAAGNDLLFLNNDVLVTPNWLENLQVALHSDPSIGAVQGLGKEHFQHLERFQALTPQAFAKENNVSTPARWHHSVVLHGYCFLLKREAYEAVGGFDERFSPGYCEDDDLSCRLLEAGYSLLKCPDCFIDHFGGGSFGAGISGNILRGVNRKKFQMKWGFSPMAAYEYSPELSQMADIREDAPEILYLGYGIGTDLLRLKTRFPGATFFGDEPNPAYARLFAKCVKPISFPLPAGQFDLIAISGGYLRAGGIYETLVGAKTALTPQGCLVFDQENAMYGEWVEKLLGGEKVLSLEDALTPNDGVLLLERLGFTEVEASPLYYGMDGDASGFCQQLSEFSGYEAPDDYYARAFAYKGQNNRCPAMPLENFPLVSILVPAYNRTDYLKVALDSALAQDYPNLEIIVSDNSTDDGVKDLVQGYPDVRYVDAREDALRGLAQNYNQLLGHASGEYISYLFDDDEYFPTKISQMMARFLEDESLSLVTSRRVFMDQLGKPITTLHHHVDISEGKVAGLEVGRRLLLEGRNFIGEPTTVLFKKSAVGELPLTRYFGHDLRFYLDVQLYLKLCLKGDVYFIDDHLSKFRWHGDQATFKYGIWLLADFFNLIAGSYENGAFLASPDDLREAFQTALAQFPLMDYWPLYLALKNTGDLAYIQSFERIMKDYQAYL
ncbi:MAG: glycosyltransferase [Turicibacter sp.]|nr:glycosyltransferase [Turicibacter sp.]